MTTKTKAETPLDPVDVAIGGRIRSAREDVRMTQSVLAQKSGVTFQQIQKYERGVNRVSAPRLILIASAVGVTGGFLLGENETTDIPGLDHLQAVASRLSPAMIGALTGVAFAMRDAADAALTDAARA